MNMWKTQGGRWRMRRGMRNRLLAAGSGLAMMALVGVAFAASGPQIPEGPYIDFCPTAEQIEAHLEQYGFDYKPTVACTEDGVELPDNGAGEEEALTAAEVEAKDRTALEGAARGPDADGDPRTIEIVYPDGSGGTILISTDDPERFKDMTPEEFLEAVYGDK
jgi:hypothetical protein